MAPLAAQSDPAHLTAGETIPAQADAIIYLSDAGRDPAAAAEHLRQFAGELRAWAKRQGQRHEVGGLPVFLVLSKCDLLARPGDDLGDWLERIEAHKEQLGRQARALLGNAGGFGSLALHGWAVARQRPRLADTPARKDESFGVAELARQAVAEAQAVVRRRATQAWRVHAAFWGVLILLAVMVLAALSLGVLRLLGDGPPALPPPATAPAPHPVVRGQELLAAADDLLGFAGYRTGEPPQTEWPRWYQDAERLRQEMARVREQLRTDGIGETLIAALDFAGATLRQLQDRAALFGLAGDLPGRPALLHLSAAGAPESVADVRALARARLERLPQAYPDFWPRPLPPAVPLAVARELHDAAQVSYEKLLAPVRAEIEARVRKRGGGKETAEAWQELARGWLLTEAETELVEWRELALLLQQLAQPDELAADPLVQLGTFLRQEEFALPLERVEVRVPAEVRLPGEVVRGLRAEGPLVIRRRTPAGAETVIPLYPLLGAPTAPRESGRAVYVVARQNPLDHGRLLYKPGDELSARLAARDEQGRRWLLSWVPSESRSAVYTLAVLTQAPRLHPEDQNNPARGAIVFDARLTPSEPRLFELPDLFPR
jgi:hypothetical protein